MLATASTRGDSRRPSLQTNPLGGLTSTAKHRPTPGGPPATASIVSLGDPKRSPIVPSPHTNFDPLWAPSIVDAAAARNDETHSVASDTTSVDSLGQRIRPTSGFLDDESFQLTMLNRLQRCLGVGGHGVIDSCGSSFRAQPRWRSLTAALCIACVEAVAPIAHCDPPRRTLLAGRFDSLMTEGDQRGDNDNGLLLLDAEADPDEDEGCRTVRNVALLEVHRAECWQHMIAAVAESLGTAQDRGSAGEDVTAAQLITNLFNSSGTTTGGGRVSSQGGGGTGDDWLDEAAGKCITSVISQITGDRMGTETAKLQSRGRRGRDEIECVRALFVALMVAVLFSVAVLTGIFASDLMLTPLSTANRHGLAWCAMATSLTSIPILLWCVYGGRAGEHPVTTFLQRRRQKASGVGALPPSSGTFRRTPSASTTTSMKGDGALDLLSATARLYHPNSAVAPGAPCEPEAISRRGAARERLLRIIDELLDAAAEAATRPVMPETMPQTSDLGASASDPHWPGERSLVRPAGAGGGVGSVGHPSQSDHLMNLIRVYASTTRGDHCVPEAFVERALVLGQTFLVTLNNNCIVTSITQAAAKKLGCQPEDIVGLPISVVIDEVSNHELTSSLESLLLSSRRFMGNHSVRFVSMQSGSIQMNVTIGRSLNAQGRNVGFALLGTEDFRLEATDHVLILKHRQQELQAEVQAVELALREGDRKSVDLRVSRISRLTSSMRWGTIMLAAHQMKHWKAVRSVALLDSLTKSHMHIIDIKFASNMPEILECDVDGILLVLTELLRDAKGRVSIDVTVRSPSPFAPNAGGGHRHRAAQLQQFADAASGAPQLIFTLSPWFMPAVVDPIVETFLNNLAATLRSDTVGSAMLLAPMRLFQRADGSSSFAPGSELALAIEDARGDDARGGTDDPESRLPGSSTGGGASFSFVLYEPNQVVRHVTSMALWSLGHAVHHVQSAKEFADIIDFDTNNTPDCLLVSSGGGDIGGLLLRELRSRSVAMHVALVAGGMPMSPNDGSWRDNLPCLPLPLAGSALDELLRTLSTQRVDRLAKRRDLDDKRRVLMTHRGAPWKRGRKLGMGSFAEVFEAESELTGGMMAVKIISLDRFDEKQVQSFMTEIEILCTLSHPHIVYYFYCEQTERTLNLFMELCHNNSLLHQLRNRGPMKAHEAQNALRQVLEAIEYLHERGVVHRDIKPANILIARDGTLKLTDFGTATKATVIHASISGGTPGRASPSPVTSVASPTAATSASRNAIVASDTAGTIRFMAPEVFDGLPHGASCDIWSVGVLYLDLIGLLPPDNGLLPSFYSDNADAPIVFPTGVPADARIFLTHCLQRNPRVRPAASTLLHHPFLSRPTMGSQHSFRRSDDDADAQSDSALLMFGADGGALAGAVGAAMADDQGSDSGSSDLVSAMPPRYDF